MSIRMQSMNHINDTITNYSRKDDENENTMRSPIHETMMNYFAILDNKMKTLAHGNIENSAVLHNIVHQYNILLP